MFGERKLPPVGLLVKKGRANARYVGWPGDQARPLPPGEKHMSTITGNSPAMASGGESASLTFKTVADVTSILGGGIMRR
jgi:hypothetical protein